MAKLLLGSVVGPQGPQGTPGVNGSQGPQGIAGPSEITAATDVVGLTPGRLLYNKSGKVGSAEIVDNLLSIDPDKPLSANQGKVLKGLIDDNDSAIGQITNDRGYINAKRITTAEMETTFVHGKYFVAGFGYLKVSSHDTIPESYCEQTLYSLDGTLVKFRVRNVGVWSSWKEIATTESYVLQSSDLRNGWKNGEPILISKSGNIVTISGYVTSGTTSAGTIILNIPASFRPNGTKNIILPTYAFPSAPVNNYFELRTNGDLVMGAVASNPSINIAFSYAREA